MYEISLYELGASIKKTTHQATIKRPKTKVMIILLKNFQLQININTPKLIIDQGWHQKGFKAQKLFLEFESIK